MPDRFDPRKVFAAGALLAAAANAALLIAPIGGDFAIPARMATGALLAGVYPVGMKIAVGWGVEDRGLLVELLVAAVTLVSALSHLIAFGGGAEWRSTVIATSLASIMAAGLALGAKLGPHHVTAARFNASVIAEAWTNRRVRLAYAGYLGHMWELYAMWAWIVAMAAASYGATTIPEDAQTLARITAFIAIGAGAIACGAAGWVADRIGKADVAILAMGLSGLSALAAAAFGGPVWLSFAIFVVWGIAIIPHSVQFSVLVADYATPERAGSLMTFQTALGFSLTFLTVQATPLIADHFSGPTVMVLLALGPAFGIAAMLKLRRLTP